MKFGKEVRERAVAGWEHAYLSYKSEFERQFPSLPFVMAMSCDRFEENHQKY